VALALEFTATAKPWPAASSAVAAPMPRLPPVTSSTCSKFASNPTLTVSLRTRRTAITAKMGRSRGKVAWSGHRPILRNADISADKFQGDADGQFR
jgi:hypothetical protein